MVINAGGGHKPGGVALFVQLAPNSKVGTAGMAADRAARSWARPSCRLPHVDGGSGHSRAGRFQGVGAGSRNLGGTMKTGVLQGSSC
jgi:hypothetical protein